MGTTQAELSNEQMSNYAFLKEIYDDEYFPAKLF